MKRGIGWIVLVAAACMTACSADLAGEPCAPYMAVGLGVIVVDEGGTRICDAQVVARDGNYSEVLRSGFESSQCAYIGASERTGTYSLRAERSGFAAGTAEGVQVVSDGETCPHVRKTVVAITLVPSSR